MSQPKILIVSTKAGKAREIAESMGAERQSMLEDTVDYSWNIDNKYYTSQVTVRTMEKLPVEFPMEGVAAFIVYHDPRADKTEEELEDLATWIGQTSSVETQIFSCSAISDATLRDKVQNWCVRNKFELVELDQREESDTEGNKYGMERIVEALHAHAWPNIVPKGHRAIILFENLILFVDKDCITMRSVTDKPCAEESLNETRELFENIRLTRDPSERLRTQDMLDGIMGEHADFGELFSRLMAMKEHAASLPSNEKRRAAEEIAIAFWRATGGDLIEIEETPN